MSWTPTSASSHTGWAHEVIWRVVYAGGEGKVIVAKAPPKP